ncbi:MAG: NAD(P)/FAD-dependent oxidoreductase [Anaerolineales bacterium]
MTEVLILGGGFGGVAAAHALKVKAEDDLRVTLVDRRPDFAIGFRKSWGLLDPAAYKEGLRPLSAVQGGVEFRQGEVETVLPEEKAAIVDGERIDADSMVIALGAAHDVGSVPGFREHVLNIYDSGRIESIHQRLMDFNGGRIGIGIFGAPYTCPPAPYEIAYMLEQFYRERGVSVEIEAFTPKPMSLPILGEAGCSVIENRLERKGIKFSPNKRALRVDKEKVEFATGGRDYDLILGVPPHRAPRLLEQAGLTEDGWVRPDPATLETTYPDVYAIGDLTWIPMANGKPLPMAGVFAESQGRAVAARIAAKLEGDAPDERFDGRGGCFLEVGDGKAVMVEGDFLAVPAPQVTISEPSEDLLAEKYEFERIRLDTWFGG